MVRPLFMISCLALVEGCGGSYIILEAQADLQIPTQVDSLQVITLDASDVGRELSNVDFPLDAGDSFPIEILLEPSDGTPARLRERVVARLRGTAVAKAEVEHPWTAGRVNRATFALELLP